MRLPGAPICASHSDHPRPTLLEPVGGHSVGLPVSGQPNLVRSALCRAGSSRRRLASSARTPSPRQKTWGCAQCSGLPVKASAPVDWAGALLGTDSPRPCIGLDPAPAAGLGGVGYTLAPAAPSWREDNPAASSVVGAERPTPCRIPLRRGAPCSRTLVRALNMAMAMAQMGHRG